MVKLEIKLGEHIQSFKNKKRAILDSNSGKMRTLTPGDVKQRMKNLENGIVSALLFDAQTGFVGTALECRKQLLTALSGLSDDSLNQIAEFSFGVEYVEKCDEGVVIEIEELK